jgi:hypothetical protein
MSVMYFEVICVGNKHGVENNKKGKCMQAAWNFVDGLS